MYFAVFCRRFCFIHRPAWLFSTENPWLFSTELQSCWNHTDNKEGFFGSVCHHQLSADIESLIFVEAAGTSHQQSAPSPLWWKQCSARISISVSCVSFHWDGTFENHVRCLAGSWQGHDNATWITWSKCGLRLRGPSYLPHSIGEIVRSNGTVAGVDRVVSGRQETASTVQWSTLQFCRVELWRASGLRTRSVVFRLVHIGCVQYCAPARFHHTRIRWWFTTISALFASWQLRSERAFRFLYGEDSLVDGIE